MATYKYHVTLTTSPELIKEGHIDAKSPEDAKKKVEALFDYPVYVFVDDDPLFMAQIPWRR